jgi:type IV pilus assembly protein PilY1
MSSSRLLLNRLLCISIFGALMLALPGLALGEDIDLYTGAPINGGNPNLLITLDNAKAWDGAVTFTCPTAGVVSANNAGKDVGFEQCALYSALNSISSSPLLNGKINMGLMLFDPSSNGANFLFPTTQPYALPLMDNVGIPAFQTVIKSIDRQTSGANNSAVGGGMQEMWAYYAGKTGLSGTHYTSPLVSCQKSFVLYIANAMGNGKPQDASNSPSAYSALQSVATTAQLQPIVIPAPYNKYQANWGDEWARYMQQTDLSNGANVNKQNITTYTIAVTDGSNPDYVRFLQSMADNGGGKAFVVNINDPNALEELIKALGVIFNEVQAVNSVFASVSLPVSVNGQGNYLNQIYVGMFRPDANGLPRWAGNLKQYQLGFDTSLNVQLEDSNGNPALNSSGTGFISPNAVSFWTSDTSAPNDGPYLYSGNSITTTPVPGWPTTGGFWKTPAAWTSPPPLGVGGAYDSPDGEVVEKGGVGESMRIDYVTSRIGRTVYTCTSCTNNNTMQSFATSNTALLSGTSLGSTTTTPTATNLINWVRGDDNTSPNNETEPGPGGLVTVRPSIHGDVLHSRPAVVNYGTLALGDPNNNANVVVYYGSNDGMFHAINGNQTAGINGVRPGGELWSFVAPEFFSKFQRLYNNSPVVKLWGATDPSAQPKDYFFDGTTTVYQDLRDPANKKVYIYLTARRGGRFIYALDVTDPTTPKFLWKKSNSDITELGQTWSQPKIALVKGHTNPVLIMGGGYDPAEDSDPAPASDSIGRAVVVLDAVDGTAVWMAAPSCTGVTGDCSPVAAMTRAIPADVTLLDRSGDGYIDRLYAADVGGNIWRVDLEPAGVSAPSGWQVTELASLAGTGNDARKFFYPPDVTPTSTYDAVLAASGDREHPLYSASTTAGTAYNVVNRFYMIKDPNTGNNVPSGWTTITETNLTDETGLAAGTTPPYSSTSTTSTGGPSSGFYITFSSYQANTQDPATHKGEKAVNAPLTTAGYTYFGTNTPDPSVGIADPTKCYPNLGIARGYAINFLTAEGMNSNGYIVFAGGGLPPSPVFGLVAINDASGASVVTPVLIGGGNQTSTAGADSTSTLGVQKIAPPTLGKRKRTYWFTEGQK